MATAPYTVKIGGTSVTVLAGSLNVQQQIGQRSTGSIRIWSALGVVYQYGTQVQVYNDAGALAFSGYTTKDKARKPGGARQGTGLLEHDITLMDNAYRADKRRVWKTYLSATCGFIVQDLLVSYLAAEGVTSQAASIATGPVVVEVIWNGSKSVGEALTWLAQQAGYWWQIDLNGVLWFQPYGGQSAPFILDGTQVDATKDLSVEYGNDIYVNKQYAKGAFATKGSKTAQLHETFKGDGTSRSFTLSYPVHAVYQVLLNGADITVKALTKGSTGGQFYYAQGDAVLAQDVGQAVLATTDTLDVYYAGRYPVIASAQSNALIAAQKAREGMGTGLVEATYTNTKVRTVAAAFQIASALLSHYGQDTTILTFATQQKGLLPGQLLTVNLPDFALSSKPMLIASVAISDQIDGFNVWFVVTAVGSPVESAQWQTYWQNLMNQSSDPSDLTDTQDAALALLLSSTVTTTWTGSVTKTKTTCPICNIGTLCNTSTIVC
jgi:hypothetical protein